MTEKEIHTNPSLDWMLAPNFAMGTNWSAVGSAQQYQGSLKKGAGRGAATGLNESGATFCNFAAAFQMWSNVSVRDSLFFPAAATMLETSSASVSITGSECCQR